LAVELVERTVVLLAVLVAVGRKRKGRNLQKGEGGARGGCPYRRQGDEFCRDAKSLSVMT